MKSKPLVMEELQTSFTCFKLDFKFTNNITIVLGESGVGKSAAFSVLEDYSADNERIMCLNYRDYQKDILEILKGSKGKLIVVDNADVLLGDDCRKFIALDSKNQYMIIGRNPSNLFTTEDNLFQLVVTKEDDVFRMRIVPDLEIRRAEWETIQNKEGEGTKEMSLF